MRSVNAERIKGAKCVVDFPVNDLIEGSSAANGRNVDQFGSSNGLFYENGQKFVDRSSWRESCTFTGEMKEHPLVRYFLKMIAAAFATMICLLCCMCCKYQQISSAYDQLKEKTKSAVQMVQNAQRNNSAADEERPNPRGAAGGSKPDRNTFGKVSQEE